MARPYPHDRTGIPSTMRAALLLGIGGPDMLQVRDDVPVPRPAPGEALLMVTACGLNNSDINTRVGWYSRSVTSATIDSGYEDADLGDVGWGRKGLSFPLIQGSDVVGVVVAVGDGVSGDLIGDRVMVDPCLRDPHQPEVLELAGYLGSERDGGFAEYCTVPAENVHPVPTNISDIELATFPCSWSTAEHMLQQAGLRSGETVAIPGASGGVGSALVHLAKMRGARVVAIAGTSKLDLVKDLGADQVVAREVDSVTEAATAANGGPFDVVADIVGGDDFEGWLEGLRRGGRYVTSGAIAGPDVKLDLRTLYLNDLSLYGATVHQPKVFSDLVGYIRGGMVQAVVGGCYRLTDINAAQEAFLAKRHVGKLVVTI